MLVENHLLIGLDEAGKDVLNACREYAPIRGVVGSVQIEQSTGELEFVKRIDSKYKELGAAYERGGLSVHVFAGLSDTEEARYIARLLRLIRRTLPKFRLLVYVLLPNSVNRAALEELEAERHAFKQPLCLGHDTFALFLYADRNEYGYAVSRPVLSRMVADAVYFRIHNQRMPGFKFYAGEQFFNSGGSMQENTANSLGMVRIVYPEKQICEHIVFTLLVQIARTLSWSWTEGLEIVQEEVLRRIGRLERMFRQTDGLVIGIFDEKRLQAFENSLMQDASFMESIRHKLSDYLSGLKEETPEPEEIVQAAYELFLGEIKMFDDRNGGNERFFDSNLLGLLSQQSQNNSTNVQAFVRSLWERAGAYIRLNPDETVRLRQNNAEAGTFTGVLVCLPEHCNGEKQQEYVRQFKQACEEQFHDIIWTKGKYNEITIIKCLSGFSIHCLSD